MRGFASAQQRWNQPWTDPCAHFQCHGGLVEGVVALGSVIGDAIFGGGAAAAPILGGTDVLAGGPIALDVTAPAIAGAGGAAAGDVGAGLAAGAGAAGGALAADAGAAGAGAAGAGPPDTVIPSGVPGAVATPIPTAPVQPPLTFASPTGATPSGAVIPASVTIPPPAAPATMGTGFSGASGVGGPAVAPAGAGGAGTGADIGSGAGIGSATGTAPPTFGDVSQFGVIDPTAGTGFQTTPSLQSSIDTALGGAPTGSVVTNVGGGAAPAAGGGAAPAAKTGGFLSDIFGTGTMDTLKELAPIAALGGLGYNLLNALKPLPGQKGTAAIPGVIQSTLTPQVTAENAAALTNTAAGTGQIGLGNYLETQGVAGQVPPGYQSAIDSAAEASRANVRAAYASRGMSGSSAEAQDLAAVGERAQAAGAQLAQQMIQEGGTLVGAGVSDVAGGAAISGNVAGQELSGEQLAAQIYNQITQTATAQDKALGDSISNFATSLAGGTRPGTVTLNLAGTPATTNATTPT